jgi:hypothetical protein
MKQSRSNRPLFRRAVAAALSASLALAPSALAVKPAYWVHTSAEDFAGGTLENVVVTNFGDVKLARELSPLLESDPRVGIVYALLEAPDGTIYAGTGPDGVVLKTDGKKVETALTLGRGVNAFALALDGDGRVLVGTGGEAGKILRVEKDGKTTELFSHDGVQYVWAIARTDDGQLYAATGPEGQLFRVDTSGKGQHEVIFDSDESNLLCLATDGKDKLYVGTDPGGLLYRIDRKTKQAFVLFDAAESEIGAIVLDGKGGVYAATSQAVEGAGNEEQKGGDEAQPGEEGRPAGETAGVPLPLPKPDQPKPPETPEPPPIRPDPIPADPAPAKPTPKQEAPGDGGGGDAPAEPTPGEPAPGKPKPKPSPIEHHQGGGAKEGPTVPHSPAGGAPAETAANGNAVYHVDEAGIVTEVFRVNATLFSLVRQGDALLIGTGNDGAVYQYAPGAEETTKLAELDTRQVVSLLPLRDGRVVTGLANAGGLSVMQAGFAKQGTYTSEVLDAKQISDFGNLRLRGSLPGETKLLVSARSGNVGDAAAAGWSAWTDAKPAQQYLPSDVPPGRFFQYRLTFQGGAAATPVLDQVAVAYQNRNAAPRVAAVAVSQGTGGEGAGKIAAEPGGHSTRTIAWEAADPNGDALRYSVYIRTSAKSPWIPIAKDLIEASYEWDTRTVADGQYEIKVVASDENANPDGQGLKAERVSAPIVVDNTPPTIGDIAVKREGDKATVELRVVDTTGTVARLEYELAGGEKADDWRLVLPLDTISDSPQERYRFVVNHLGADARVISVRATDGSGNVAHQSIVLEPAK